MLYGRRERWFQFVNLHGDRTQCKWLQTNYNLTSSKQDHRESCSASAAQLTQWEHPLAPEEFGFRPNLSTKVALSHLSKNILGNMDNGWQVTSIGNSLSSPRSVTVGVPQGSVLEPLLFITYVNDLPQSLKYCKTILNEDDTFIYYSAESTRT